MPSTRLRQSLKVIPHSLRGHEWRSISGPYVNEDSFHLIEEGSQPSVILELVVIHHLVHLLPCSISFGVEAAGRGLTFCFRDVVP